ncbi:MAG: hypothetical protein ONB44_06705 [candidate division KSB1 bacterium]|nr:hypothetical protein [candidate division KSB1 bacterium]
MVRVLWLLLLLLPTVAAGQWQIEAFLGPVKIISHDVEIRQPQRQTALIFHTVAYSGEALRVPLYYGIRIGKFLRNPNWLGGEIEFIHNKAYARTERTVHVTGSFHGAPYDARIPMKTLLRDFSFSHGDNLALANVVLQKRWWKLQWRGRLGLGLGIPHAESTFEGEHQEQFDLTFPAVQIALGFAGKIGRQAEVLAEYKFTSNNLQDVRIAHGHADTQILAHHFVAGVGYVF